MGTQRREFSTEYKDEAVGLVINTDRTVTAVARELGTSEATLGRWVNLHKGPPGHSPGPAERVRASQAGQTPRGGR